MAHTNRHNMGNFWPVAKKGNKYVAVSSHNESTTIPLVIALRDVLGLVRTNKELKKAINDKQIRINEKEIRDTNFPVGLFDVIVVGDKTFRVTLGLNKKFKIEESGNDGKKGIKIIGKKNLGKKGIQLNLMDGRNVLSKVDAGKGSKDPLGHVNVGDSVIFDYKSGKITEIVKMAKGSDGFVIRGKHTGVHGKIKEIIEQGGKKIAVIDHDKHKINVWVKNVIAM